MKVYQAYRFALDPTWEQAEAFRSHCGASRFAFNWGLARVKVNLAQRKAERSYGVAEDQLTPSLSWTRNSMVKAWNLDKHTVAVDGEGEPWWRANSKSAYASGLANLESALVNWRKSKAGIRVGPGMRFPRFKSKRGRWSVTFDPGSDGTGLDRFDRRHVKLARIGRVRVHGSTRKLARRVERGTARILFATVSHSRGRWWISFTCEVDRADPSPRYSDTAVGVDLGVRRVATTSEPVPGLTDYHGVVVNPGYLERAERGLRRTKRVKSRRRGPDRRTGREASNRWLEADAVERRRHTRVVNLRRDAQHQLTTRLARRFGRVGVEDLNVRGMTRSARGTTDDPGSNVAAKAALNRRIADVGMAEIRRQLAYKIFWRGGMLVVADRWFPSSKMCSNCGVVKTKLTLSERTYVCECCGLRLDRDLNAARNLADLARTGGVGASTESCAGTVNKPAGNLCKTSLAGYGYRHGKDSNAVSESKARSAPSIPSSAVHGFSGDEG